MRKIVITSVAALASLVVSAHVAATAITARALNALMEQSRSMLSAQLGMAQLPGADIWYIKGVTTLAAGGTRDTQFMIPDEDRGGQMALLTFDSKDECEEARATDPDVVDALARIVKFIKERGDSMEVSCAKWEHPVKFPGQDI